MTGNEEKIVIGHRGSRELKPENTIPAFIKALQLGARGLELDLFLTRDNKVVVTHDAIISAELCLSPEGEPLSQEDGKRMRIYGLDLKDLKPFDCGSEPNPDFPYQDNTEAHIPLLTEVIKAVNQYAENATAIGYFMELKSDPATDHIYHPEPAELVERVLEVIEWHKIEGQSLIMSFDKRCLKEVKKQAPNLMTGLSLEEETEIQQHLDELGFIPDAIFPYYSLINKSLMGFCKVEGLKVYPWTVNEEEEIRKILKFDIAGLITDYPDRALKQMNERL